MTTTLILSRWQSSFKHRNNQQNLQFSKLFIFQNTEKRVSTGFVRVDHICYFSWMDTLTPPILTPPPPRPATIPHPLPKKVVVTALLLEQINKLTTTPTKKGRNKNKKQKRNKQKKPLYFYFLNTLKVSLCSFLFPSLSFFSVPLIQPYLLTGRKTPSYLLSFHFCVGFWLFLCFCCCCCCCCSSCCFCCRCYYFHHHFCNI